MGADLARFETKFILSHNKGGCAQCSAYVHTCDATDSAQGVDKCVDGSVDGGPFVVAEALYKRRCLADWAHDVVVSVEQCDRLHAVAVLLVPECH